MRDAAQRELGTAFAVGEPEPPVLDGVAATPPVVGPREDERPAGALFEGNPKLHRRKRRLTLLPFAQAVGPTLSQQQRPVAGDELQVRQVGPQLRFAMQIHVERTDVEERQIEVVRRAGSSRR